jgi:hypothetical protein
VEGEGGGVGDEVGYDDSDFFTGGTYTAGGSIFGLASVVVVVV